MLVSGNIDFDVTDTKTVQGLNMVKRRILKHLGKSTDFDASKARELSEGVGTVESDNVARILSEIERVATKREREYWHDGFIDKADIEYLRSKGFNVSAGHSFKNEQYCKITW